MFSFILLYESFALRLQQKHKHSLRFFKPAQAQLFRIEVKFQDFRCQKWSRINQNLFQIVFHIKFHLQVHRKLQFFNNQIFQNTEMQLQNEGNSEKRQYARITLKNKVNLIRMVFRRRVPLQEAIQELGLKKTTALNIIKRYKDTGSFPMRKYKRTRKNKQKKSIIKIEELEQDSQNQSVPNGQQLPKNELNHEKIQYIYNPCQYSWVGYPIVYYCSF